MARRSSLGGNENRTSPPMFQKLASKKPSNVKVEPGAHTGALVSEDNPLNGDGKQLAKPEIKRALFDEKQIHDRVAPGGETSVVVSNETGDVCRHQTDCEDLSRIRRQLVQIENQQSNLLEILQVFYHKHRH